MWSQAPETLFIAVMTTGKRFADRDKCFAQCVGQLDKVHGESETLQKILLGDNYYAAKLAQC